MASPELNPSGGNGAATRRSFLARTAAGLGIAGAGAWAYSDYTERGQRSDVFVGRADSYDADLRRLIAQGLAELGLAGRVRGLRILLKPNLVEPHAGAGHINTHPLLVRAAIEAFLSLDAAEVAVAEGQGHIRDSHLVLEQSGFSEILVEDRIRYIDLNDDEVEPAANAGGCTNLKTLLLPRSLGAFDWIVSMPKLKTHHWVGVTLSLKNLFGVMPGRYYGWPKNVFHQAGINDSILDIAATVPTRLAIADGIVGMEGDGPIMGAPRSAGVVVMGENLVAVDATACRVMGIEPRRVPYLKRASGWLGPIRPSHIGQRGEDPAAVRTDFELLDYIDAQKGLRLGEISLL